MSILYLAVALIRECSSEGTRHLIRRPNPSQPWQFIRTPRLEGESDRHALSREVALQLGLENSRDILVSTMAQLTIEDDVDIQVAAPDQPSRLSISFYPVQLYGPELRRSLKNSQDLYWANAEEICAGQTQANGPIDPQVVKWIRRWDIIQHWE